MHAHEDNLTETLEPPHHIWRIIESSCPMGFPKTLKKNQRIERKLEWASGQCHKGTPMKVRARRTPMEPMPVEMDSSQCGKEILPEANIGRCSLPWTRNLFPDIKSMHQQILPCMLVKSS